MSVCEDPRSDAALDGFETEPAMRAAHAPIVHQAAELLCGRGGPVLDLGCGSGALLETIATASPCVVPYGVEIGPLPARAARERLGPLGGGVFEGDLFEIHPPWQSRTWRLILLMPGRLLEVPAETAAGLRIWLAQSRARVLAYAYGDWLDRFGGLDGLAAQALLPLTAAEIDRATGYPRWRTCAPLVRADRSSLRVA